MLAFCSFGTHSAAFVQSLGTGEHDLSVLLDAYQSVERTTFFGGIGYHVLGDAPGLPLDNVWSVNAGASYRVDERDSVALRVLTSPAEQARQMAIGTRRLLLLTLHSPTKALRRVMAAAPGADIETQSRISVI